MNLLAAIAGEMLDFGECVQLLTTLRSFQSATNAPMKRSSGTMTLDFLHDR